MKKLLAAIIIAATALANFSAQAASIVTNPDGSQTVRDNYGNVGVLDKNGKLQGGIDRYGNAGVISPQGQVTGVDRYGNAGVINPAPTQVITSPGTGSPTVINKNNGATTYMTPGHIVKHEADGSTTIIDGNSGTITKIPAQ